MNTVEQLMKDTYIKETIGYELFDKVPESDKDKIIEFCKIVWNYLKLNKILSNERETVRKHERKRKVCSYCGAKGRYIGHNCFWCNTGTIIWQT